MKIGIVWRYLILFLVLLAPRKAFAHDPNISSVRILKQLDGFLISVQTHISKLAIAEGIPESSLNKVNTERLIEKRLTLRFAGSEPKLTKTFLIFDKPGDVVTLQKSYEGALPELSMDSRLYPEMDASATIVAVMEGTQVVSQFTLDVDHPRYKKDSNASLFGQYLKLGVSHILTGLDHVLFILGLILLGGSLKSMIKMATAFTVAHSLTLALSVCEIVSLPSRIIEPLIALSVAFVGIEFFYPITKENWRPLITFAFGLIHGFGFAGVLQEIGLPSQAIPVTLGAFNLGVEIGQLAIVLILVPLLAVATKKYERPTKALKSVVAVFVCCLGSFWFVERLLSR